MSESPLKEDPHPGSPVEARRNETPDVSNQVAVLEKAVPSKKKLVYSDDPETLQNELGLAPRSIVLAKVKGYRAWPAMVLAYDILPENIKKMKPKSVKQAKKSPTPVIVVPVRFFSDDTYIWIKSVDLKPLLSEDIQTFLDKRANAKKHDPLIDAYNLAKNPPDMDEFNRWGSQGPPPEVPETTDDLMLEESEEEANEPAKKKLKIKLPARKPAKKAAKSKPSKRQEKEDPGFADYAEFEKELDDLELPSEEYDSDWGTEEANHNFDTGDYIFEEEEEQKHFEEEFPSAATLTQTLTHYTKYLDQVHKNISPKLLLGEFSEKEVLGEILKIEKHLSRGEMPLVAFTRSALFRSLLLVLHKPKQKFSLRSVRGAIERLFKLLSLEPATLTMEDLVIPTPEETPAPDKEPASQNGTDLKEETEGEGIDIEKDEQNEEPKEKHVEGNVEGNVENVDENQEHDKETSKEEVNAENKNEEQTETVKEEVDN